MPPARSGAVLGPPASRNISGHCWSRSCARSSRFRGLSMWRFLRARGVGCIPRSSPCRAWSPSRPSWPWRCWKPTTRSSIDGSSASGPDHGPARSTGGGWLKLAASFPCWPAPVSDRKEGSSATPVKAVGLQVVTGRRHGWR